MVKVSQFKLTLSLKFPYYQIPSFFAKIESSTLNSKENIIMIKFAKYHGLGNDFIILKAMFHKGINYSELAIKMCNRHTGIGADGLIVAHFNPRVEMVFYNADGSRAEMCGNGIRCFANFLYDEQIITQNHYTIDTLAGPQLIFVESFSPFRVNVNMGKGEFRSEMIPTLIDDGKHREKVTNIPLSVNNQTFYISSLLLGVPHTVVRVNHLAETDMNSVGKTIESHPWFPHKTNVDFIEVVSKGHIKMQTYERGAGLTLACGTGACASVVMGNYLGYLAREVCVELPLGNLNIRIDSDDSVYMTGPAEKICQGE